MNDTDLQIQDRDGVRWIVLNRPATKNALTVPLVERLAAAFAEAADPAVRVVVVSGAGGAFCSGLDLKAAMSQTLDPEAGITQFHALARNLRGLLKPTIAAMDGAAAGFGADMALGCDLRIASERASLGERFVRIGLMPDGGGTFYLPRLIGMGKALELLYEGRMIDAAEALQIGLVNRVLPTEGFQEAVHAYAAELAKGPPLAYAGIKTSILRTQREFDEALASEREHQLRLIQSEDFAEGVQSFLTRTPPQFKGR